MKTNSFKNVWSLLAIPFYFLWASYSPAQPIYNIPIAQAEGQQTAPQILATNDLSGAFLFWLDNRNHRSEIFGQFLTRDGVPSWPNGKRFFKRNRAIISFSVTTDRAGGGFMVWQEIDSSSANLYVMRFRKDGALAWRKPVSVGQKNKLLVNPKAIDDLSGGVYVVWELAKISGSDAVMVDVDILAQHLDANGQKVWQDGGMPVVEGANLQRLADAVAIPGELGVAWEEKNAVYLQLLKFENGKPIHNSGGIRPVLISVGQSRPRLAARQSTSEASVFMVWQEGKNLRGQRISAKGERLWGVAGVDVVRSEGSQFNHEIMDDGKGGLLVAWQDDPNKDTGIDLRAQRLSKSGKRLWAKSGKIIIAAAGNQTNLKISTNFNEGFYCLWEDERTGEKDLYAQQVSRSGNLKWDKNGVPVSTYSGIQSNTRLLSFSQQKILAVWQDSRSDNLDIFAQYIFANGQLDNVAPQIVSQPILTGAVGDIYQYQVRGADIDRDLPLEFSLLQGPEWLQFDGSTHLLSGIVPNRPGETFPIEIQVEDARGAQGTQEFAITIVGGNHPPKITSFPDTTVFEDSLYVYQIEFEDPDLNDSHRLIVDQLPAWLQADTLNFKLFGRPQNENVGGHKIAIQIVDQFDAQDQQEYTLHVLNTNDPPFFISTPDTLTFVDSLYQYQVEVGDLDPEDSLTVDFSQGPSWLQWNAATLLLQGTPPASAANDSFEIRLQVKDLADAVSLQQYFLYVFAKTPPDSVPPGSPDSFFITPATWTHQDSLTLHWISPEDESGISGLFFKFNSAPAGANDFDLQFTVANPVAGSDSIRFPARFEGNVPIYFWLQDTAGNADFHTAVRVNYKADHSKPSAPELISPSAWSRGDSVRFIWLAARDSVSGIESYFLDLQPIGFVEEVKPEILSQDTLQVVLPLKLAEKIYTWFIAAFDSAGNSAASETLSVAIDNIEPLIIHSPLDTVSADSSAVFQARVTDFGSGLQTVELLYRQAGKLHEKILPMAAQEDSIFQATLPASEISPEGLEYRLRATDKAGNRKYLPVPGGLSEYKSAVVLSKNISAPQPTRAHTYEMISFPYNLLKVGLREFFENNLGPYDDTQWRLLRYQEGKYVELTQGQLDSLRPGRAYWLITGEPKTLKMGETASILTDRPFVISLRPGWNMIGMPFPFPIELKSVLMPAGIETVLWRYDGSKYVPEQNALTPWAGYFVKNNTSEDKEILLSPVPVPGALKKADSWPEMEWVAKIGVEINGLSDEYNFFGIGVLSPSEPGKYNFSEPPAIGKVPRLYFIRPGSFNSEESLAGDFHDSRTGRLTWEIEIGNLTDGNLRLWLQNEKAWPDSFVAALTEVKSGISKILVPGERVNFLSRAGEKRKRFKLEIGKREKLEHEQLLPTSLTLYPLWPNPFRRSSGKNLVIRFALPEPAKVALKIYNILGQEVWSFDSNASLGAGEHALVWDGKSTKQRSLASGIYWVTLVTRHIRLQRKIIILH